MIDRVTLQHYASGRLARVAVLALVFLAVVLAAGVRPAFADTGWVVERFAATYEIRSDSSVLVNEVIDVDFRDLRRNGIIRHVNARMGYDDTHDRRYRYDVLSVRDRNGDPWNYALLDEGSVLGIRIGDADVEVTGRQRYDITYELRGALNPFEEHDELFWNATGSEWSVPIEHAEVTVRTETPSLIEGLCFQGPAGSREECATDLTPQQISFASTRPLQPQEQVTIVAVLEKGAVANPEPILEERPRDVDRFFDINPLTLVTTLLLGILGVGAVVANWYRNGRDRRYTSIPYLTGEEEETVAPLAGNQTVVVEYTPPDAMLPGEIGVLIDQRVDQRDVTATIIDLAVRGYLEITEIDAGGLSGLFGGKDWELTRTDRPDGDLKKYERTILRGLFSGNRRKVKLSDLRNRFYTTLGRVRKELYEDLTDEGWFKGNPDTARNRWAFIGVLIMILGGIALVGLGSTVGWGLLGIPIIATGGLAMFTSRWMARRTAKGSEMLRRIKGFELYIRTAETRRQEFNEKAHIFADYLPYAIVFRCVDRWAKAFEGIDTEPSTSRWYHGQRGIQSMAFAGALNSFSSSTSSTISSTPGSSGGSGRGGGGSSGGGGGGGGGSSWSDRAMKTDFAPVERGAVLARITGLPIESWRYRDEPEGVRHVGPMAQDFHAAFGLGDDPRRIAHVDAQGITLAAIQELSRLIEQRDRELAALRERVAELEQRLAREQE